MIIFLFLPPQCMKRTMLETCSLFVLVCFVEHSPISRRRVSDEPSPDICRPAPWLVDDTQVDRRHPVGVSQWADGVEAGTGEDELGEVGSLVVLAANDPRHQREGGRVGQHVAGVPVEWREGAVARTPQVRAQLVRPLVELGKENTCPVQSNHSPAGSATSFSLNPPCHWSCLLL